MSWRPIINGIRPGKAGSHDSALVGGVSSEPVSELGFSGPGDSGPDSKTFVDDNGSVRGPFRTRIGRNLDFFTSVDRSCDVP